MRVLWLSHSAGIGGAELALLEGVEALQARSHEVQVVLPEVGPLLYRLGEHTPIHVVRHKAWASGRRAASDRAEAIIYNGLVAAPQIARLAGRVKPDVIVSNTVTTMAGALAARRAQVPHVWFLHEFGAEDHGMRFTLGSPLTFGLMRRLARLCIVNSDAMRERFGARLPGVDLRLARYAVSVPARAPRAAAADDADVDERALRLVLVGARTASKGQLDAVRALAQLGASGLDARLDLIGRADEDYERELRAAVHGLGVDDRVRFVPFDPDPFARMCEADVVLMCSRAEALGRVTIEAMKAGRPVVGTASGATPELVRHGWNGYLYRPGDADDLARWLRACHTDRDGAREMGRRGQAWARDTFNLDRYGDDLETALASARR
jgi:glycosyltransferase involved in cell wall biosynthesis